MSSAGRKYIIYAGMHHIHHVAGALHPHQPLAAGAFLPGFGVLSGGINRTGSIESVESTGAQTPQSLCRSVGKMHISSPAMTQAELEEREALLRADTLEFGSEPISPTLHEDTPRKHPEEPQEPEPKPAEKATGKEAQVKALQVNETAKQHAASLADASKQQVGKEPAKTAQPTKKSEERGQAQAG